MIDGRQENINETYQCFLLSLQAFVYLMFWYQLYCGFSASVMIDQMYLMLYNLVFTSLPPLVIGVYDKTVTEDLLFAKPYLYRYVSTKTNFSMENIFLTFALLSFYRVVWESHIDRIHFG